MTENATLKNFHGLREAHLKHASDKDKDAMETQVPLFAVWNLAMQSKG